MFDWAWVSGSRTFTELSQRSPVLCKVHMRVFFSRHFMRRGIRLSHKAQMGDLLDPSHFYLHDLWSSVRMTILVLGSWLHLFFIFGFDRHLWEEFWLFQSSSSSWRWCRELTLHFITIKIFGMSPNTTFIDAPIAVYCFVSLYAAS